MPRTWSLTLRVFISTPWPDVTWGTWADLLTAFNQPYVTYIEHDGTSHELGLKNRLFLVPGLEPTSRATVTASFRPGYSNKGVSLMVRTLSLRLPMKWNRSFVTQPPGHRRALAAGMEPVVSGLSSGKYEQYAHGHAAAVAPGADGGYDVLCRARQANIRLMAARSKTRSCTSR